MRYPLSCVGLMPFLWKEITPVQLALVPSRLWLGMPSFREKASVELMTAIPAARYMHKQKRKCA